MIANPLDLLLKLYDMGLALINVVNAIFTYSIDLTWLGLEGSVGMVDVVLFFFGAGFVLAVGRGIVNMVAI